MEPKVTLKKIKGTRVPADASSFVAEYGTIFYDEFNGELRLGDDVTPGGIPLTGVESGYKKILAIPSWPPSYIAPNIIYKIFDSTTNTVVTWETDANATPYKVTDPEIAVDLDVHKIFVNSAGLPISPYTP